MAAAARLLLRRATSAVAEAAVGRPYLSAPARRRGVWAAVSAAVAEAPPGGAAPSSDFFAFLGNFGVPTALVVAATTGAFLAIRQFGELSAKVAASEKAIAAAAAANKESAASAVAAIEAKMAASEKAASAVVAANKESAASAVAAAEAKMVANKESAASAVAATEAKLAAAEKVIAAMMAGVPVAAELATLKALKGEPKR